MRTLCLAIPLIWAATLLTSPSNAPPLALKCGVPAGEPLVSIDGVLQPAGARADDIGHDQIHSVDIVCMNPEDSTFNRSSGIPVISVWTVDGPAPQMTPMLAAIHELQTAHLAEHGAYAGDLDGFDRSAYPEAIQVFLQTGDGGWMAVTHIDRLLSRCVVFDGAWRSPNPRLKAGEPGCLSSREFSRQVWPEEQPR